jgi:UDP-N-acetylglucosamine--N-acetylmuramyl-(pentapeptide) pyrophosphoryl-undecaprenol N-acetylglucosamine transferase
VVAARRILRREGVRMVLGLGGYASLPTVLAAWTLGLPTALHEANAVAGRANLLAGRVVDSVLLGFDDARSGFAPTGELTGIPVREEIVRLSGAPRPPLGDGPRRVLVVGGSCGSSFLDAHVPDLLRRVVARGVPVVVRHQVGAGDVAVTRAAYAAARIEADVVPYLDDMAAAYAAADFVVTSAGANTLAELAVAGLPALVVPLASAAFDHQTVNARAFAALTEVPWTKEEAFAPDPLADAVASILGSDAAWRAASARIRRAARADAADAVVRACLVLTCGDSRAL